MTRFPSGAGGRAAFWALLVLPVALGAGWLLGRIPEPVRAPGPSAAPAAGGSTASVSAQAVAAPTSATAPAGDEVSSWTTYESAVSESRRTGKPILIDFSADWCGPCRRLKSEVFDHGVRGIEVQKAVIPVAIVDRVREHGSNSPSIESLQREHGVDAFPTLVVYSPGTGRTQKTRGYGSAEATLTWIVQAAKSVR